ncbi:MAG: hypothetical protein VB584_00575, partial [Candidatus Nitrosopelagicus sp.]
MKPENKAHGQFTYFQAIIEDEYLVLDFNDNCGFHMYITDDTLVQIYKKLDDLVLEEWEVGGDFMMEQQIEFTSNNELMLNFDHNYIFLKFSSKIEMKEFFAYFKKEIESSLELDKQSILKAEIIGDKTIVPEDNSLLRLNPQDIENFKQDIENFKIYKNAMRNKSYTDIEKDFQKIVDEIPLGLRMNYYKLWEPINQCFRKYVSEITKVPIGNVGSLFGRMKDAHDHHFEGFEKEDMDLINFSRDFHKKFIWSLQFHNEVIREAKSQVISIVGKELEKHDKI